jgi:hypothetical protein
MTEHQSNAPAGPSAASDDFARQAEQSSAGIVTEFIQFLRHNKKWWLLPIILVLLAVGVLVVLSSTALAPFIYTLF